MRTKGQRQIMHESGTDYEVSVGPLPDLAALGSLWRELEARAAPNFFLSWDWLGPWLEGVDDRPSLAKVKHGGRVAALGLLGSGRELHFGVGLPSLYLNQTGRRVEDSVYIEFNGLLTEEGDQGRALEALLQHMSGFEKWQVFHLSGIPGAILPLLERTGLPVTVQKIHLAPFVNLADVSSSDTDYLQSLNRNTRQQIRRAMRLYEERGALSLARVFDKDIAEAWIEDMGAKHGASREQRGEPGAFSNRFFFDFVKNLVLGGLESGRVDLLQFKAGDDVIGYLLNLIEPDRVLQYQSGFHYEQDNRLKPGLVAHVLAIEHYRKLGKSVYHFLAGDSQYKSSLSNSEETLYWVSLRQPGLFFSLEQLARRITGRGNRL